MNNEESLDKESGIGNFRQIGKPQIQYTYLQMYDEYIKAQDKISELENEVHHWKANHAHEVERARLLKSRTDLPIERLQAYDRASIDNINELVGALEIMTPIYHQLAWIAVCWNDHNFDADDVYKKINTAFSEAGFSRGAGVNPVNNFVEKLDNLIAKHKKGL